MAGPCPQPKMTSITESQITLTSTLTSGWVVLPQKSTRFHRPRYSYIPVRRTHDINPCTVHTIWMDISSSSREAWLVLCTLEEYSGFTGGQAESREPRRIWLYQTPEWNKECEAPQPQRRHLTKPKDSLITRSFGYLGQKTRREVETKEQNNHCTKTNTIINN